MRSASTRVLTGGRSPEPQGGRLRDRFELLVPLGSGGFGTVWEGFDMLLERPVAIKEIVLDGELNDIGGALREARATARLNHPAIVSLYEIVSEGDRIYMINELVHGHTLGELIDDGTLSDNDIGRIGYGLCEALAHAHAQGVLHRDVKPANAMVTTAWLEGSGGWRVQPAKLMDFGIASIVDAGEGGIGPHAGSRGYVAPEQAAGAPASDAADVYSLALVLFECFAGSSPGRGRHGRLTRLRSDLPWELADCIDQCLDPEPMLRPTVAELGAVLYEALPELGDTLRSPGFRSRMRNLFGRRRRAPSVSAPAARVAPAPREPGSGRLWRFAIAALAAAMCAATMLAVSMPLSPFPPAICALLVFVLPRAGWALAATAGAVVLAAEGQVGSAMFIVLPALVAAFAAMVPLPRVIDGALAGAGAFIWVVAMQALSGTSLALSIPPDVGPPQDVQRYADVAADAMLQFASPAYAAALGVWALAGAIAVLLADRRAPAMAWAALLLAFCVVQIAVGEGFDRPVSSVFLIVIVLLTVGLVGAAAALRRTGRVFAESGVRAAAPAASARERVRA